MDSQAGRIVVGYDGTALSDAAVDWAAAEAERRQVPLTVLHVLDYLGMIPGPVGPPVWPNLAEKAALEVAGEGVLRARKTASTIEITAVTKIDRIAYTLIESSRSAALLVVGTRGRGDAVGALLGSVAFAVSAHAACPVVVVRGDSAQLSGPGRPVVVGVDGSPSSDAAVRHAVDVALSTSAALRIVTAFQSPATQAWAQASLYTVENEGGPTFGTIAQAAAEKVVAGAVLIAREHAGPQRAGQLDVSTEAIEGPVASALVQASTDAGLLVVGSRGHGGFVGLMLGSVSHGVIHSARCPVAILRAAPVPA